MAEPQIPEPVPQPTDPAASSLDELPPDPLLGSDSFIDPDRVEPEEAFPEQEQVGLDPATAIAAQPISMLRPGEEPVTVEKTPRRKNMDEMSVRPSWLPEGWDMSLRVRASGNSAGFIDRSPDVLLVRGVSLKWVLCMFVSYYIEPTGQRKFRSKNEVLHFLETGSKKKKRSTSATAATPSESPAKQNKSAKRGDSPAKKNKSAKRGKKSGDVNSDAAHPQNATNGVDADAS
ncbi:methyl-CpG-binding domain-containing family protein [Striga asiatica]|uniref:Methyl-CpG-binding domain-containing family protein n=1 Tax=Striga asiatica TaxID=4170 RepID=A0A5A7PKP6_STRAF|nr:methyl-CpG-binding domain-containing family protein [Striga asiatica]